jgi:RHS repeat-associated protein
MKKLALLVSFVLLPIALYAQNTGVGLVPFGSFTQFGFDTVNNQNLNTILTIPIVSSTGRGLPLSVPLTYNSQIYGISGGLALPVSNFGWVWDLPPGGTSSYTTSSYQVKCYQAGYPLWTNRTTYGNYYYVDALGRGHSFPNISRTYIQCGNTWSGTSSSYASDASGYFMSAFYGPASVTGPGGQQYPSSNTAVDANGNYITRTVVSSTETDWKDSVGNTALKILYTPNSTNPTQIQYQFLDGTGASNYQTMTLRFQSLSVKTNFGCAVTDYTGTATVPQELDIPTPAGGTLKYLFSYEQTPGLSGFYSGRLQRVTLPTGGYYEYDYPGANDSVNCSDGTTLTMNRVVNDATNSATWNFVRNAASRTTTITTPTLADTANANDSVYSFDTSGRETSRLIYANSPGTTLLRTINTTWAANGTPATKVTILEDNSTKAETDTAYDSNGLLDSVTEYDWGTGAHGSASPIRTTTFSYQTAAAYTSRNIINLVTSKVIMDSGGVVQYRQDTAYDGVALASCPAGVPQHDDTGHPCTMNYRGNPTAVTTYLAPATPANGITKNFTYDWFGNVLSAQLNCCTNKTWTYSATTQYSQPDSAQTGTSPTQLTTTYTYNIYTGLATKSTDPNGLEADYFYDFLRRQTQVSQKNGATNGQSVTNTYDDVAFTTTSTATIDSSKSTKQITAADGLGRTLTTTLKDVNNNLFSIVKNEYDLTGRTYGVSNPYTTTPSYWTTTAFDALGRVTKVTLPDNSNTGYTYATNSVTATDPALKPRKTTVDAAGRTIVVTEPDVTNGNALTVTTNYSYTVLDALASVTTPDQTRTYAYDALGRLLSTTTPEGGKTCFGSVSGTTCNADGYDNFDNLLKRTDARGVLTSYSYDGLNRPSQVSYNVGTTGVPATATVSFTYGLDSSCISAHGAGCIGQAITMTDGLGSENYSYNSLEQETQLQKVISGATYTTGYSYNLAGELTQITYPSLRVVQQSVDAIGRLCEVAPSTTGCGAATAPFATGFVYSPAGQTTSFKYGNGIYASFGYSNERLQLACLDYSTTNRSGGSCTHDSTTKFGLNYSYGTAGGNNGQIAGITDSVDNGRSATYTYDALYRLTRAVTTGSTSYPAWGLSEAYNRYGSRTAQSIYSGCTGVTCPTNLVSVSLSTNRINSGGYAYDLNGNMTNDGMNTLVYDAENHAISATNGGASGTYTYDGAGLRVKKVSGSTTTVTIFSGGHDIAEYVNGAAPSSPTNENIYAGNQMIAAIQSGTTYYFHNDHLSHRLQTNTSGAVVNQRGHFPFGENWYSPSGAALIFTSYYRDAESGNDYASARYYANRLARFLSLDPLSGSASDPQSLNRYSYVENDATDLIDPSGQCPYWGPFGVASKTPGKLGVIFCTDNLTGNGGPDQLGALAGDGYNPLSNQQSFIVCSSVGGATTGCTVYTYTQIPLPSNNQPNGIDWAWWSTFGKTFANGILHGVRQPGQSFGACVLQNANETTFGRHQYLVGAVVATATAAVSNTVQVSLPGAGNASGDPGVVSGTAALALNVGRFVYVASGGFVSGLTVIRPVALTVGVAGRAAPYVVAAEAGLLIGSAINCR